MPDRAITIASSMQQNPPAEGFIRLGEIPLILYREMTEFLGNGIVYTQNKESFFSELQPDNAVTGFTGGVWFFKSCDHFIFELYTEVPRWENEDWKDMVFAPRPVLKIVGGAQRAGMWAAGSGELMKESLWADFPHNIHLQNKAVKLSCLILLRASALATRPNCLHETYWSSERTSG